MLRLAHVGKIYRVSKNESGYLLWIPKRLAAEVGISNGSRVAILVKGKKLIVVPADEFGEVGELAVRDTGEAAV